MNKKKKKAIIIIALILIGILGYIKLGTIFSPGSYSYAEVYEFNYSETQVLEAISKFKIQHPEISVPKVTIENHGSFDLSESEGRKDNSFWYSIYFYYPEVNQIVSTWTRPSGEGKTSFALVGLNNGLDIGHWKIINHDFPSKENKQIKKDFEKRILEPIRKILTEK
jgi:hypothetical protein